MANTTDTLINSSGQLVRRPMKQAAKLLNRISKGKLTPNSVTIVGLIAHLPIAWLIATEHNLAAAILLIIFGLFDTLDGELARLQHRVSESGMLLDSVTDRFKEVIIYLGIAYALFNTGHRYLVVFAMLALGASICVSYVNARADSIVLAKSKTSEHNKQFRGGIMRFEVRMVIIVLGLLLNELSWAVILVAILASYTAITRLINATNKLDVQS